MRQVIIFDEDIEKDTVASLINEISCFEEVDLYFTTDGGSLTAIIALIRALNNHPDITIYLTDVIASTGTYLLINCHKPIVLTKELDYMLFHQIDRDFGGKFRREEVDRDILYNQLWDYNQEIAMKFKRLGLNKKEMKKYSIGEDVVLYRKDFNRLIANNITME